MKLFALMMVGVALASLLHELTHLAVARALGRRAEFRILEWAVYHETSGRVTAGDWLVQGAPLLVGVLCLPLLVYWWPVHPALVIAWLFYTFVGALTNDFDFKHEEPDSAR